MVPLLAPPPVPPPPQATVAKTAATGSASALRLVNLIWFPLSRLVKETPIGRHVDPSPSSRRYRSRSRSGRECAGEGRGHEPWPTHYSAAKCVQATCHCQAGARLPVPALDIL